jgi:hypothetical protein
VAVNDERQVIGSLRMAFLLGRHSFLVISCSCFVYCIPETRDPPCPREIFQHLLLLKHAPAQLAGSTACWNCCNSVALHKNKVNDSVTAPYSLRASASLPVEQYTCNSYRRNHQKPSTQPAQELVRKHERWLWADRDSNPGANAHG